MADEDGDAHQLAMNGRPGSSMILRVSSRSLASSSNSSPSSGQSIVTLRSAGAVWSSRLIEASPAPDADW